MYYSEAKTLMASARNADSGKPLQNNTRLYERGGDSYAVQLHYTDVVTIHPDGFYTLRTGGWETVTTRDRITSYAPAHNLLSVRGEWQLPVRPSVSDPEPEIRERTVPKPFNAADPGPEPVKSPEGCIAGQLLVRGVMETAFLYDQSELRRADRPKIYYPERITNAPTPARRVLEWLDQADASYTSYCVERPGVERVEYGEQSHVWRVDYRKMPTWKYEQCHHCKAFDALHSQWYRRMYGADYGRSQKRGHVVMCDMLERFGSREAWQEAYITEFRTEREDRKVYREWRARNWVRFYDGVRIDRDGFVPRVDAERIFKADRAVKRAERRREIEHEQRQREARKLQRFKDRVRRQRGESFEVLAVATANDLRALRERLEER